MYETIENRLLKDLAHQKARRFLDLCAQEISNFAKRLGTDLRTTIDSHLLRFDLTSEESERLINLYATGEKG